MQPPPLSLWTRCQLFFRGISNEDTALIARVMSEQDLTIQEVAAALFKAQHHKYDLIVPSLRNRISHFSPEQLGEMVCHFIEEACQSDSSTSFKHLYHFFTEEQRVQIRTALLQDLPEGSTLENEILRLQEQFLRIPEPPKCSAAKKEVDRAFIFMRNFIPNLLEVFIAALNIADRGEAPENAWEASGMIDIYVKIFLIPTVIFAVLNVLGIVSFSWLITAVIVVGLVILVYVYLRWLRPCPQKISDSRLTENLTQKAHEWRIKTSVELGREADIQRLIAHYSEPNTHRQELLLIGPSGTGKSTLVEAFANRLAHGGDNIPESLQNMNVLKVSTAWLKKKKYGRTNLEKLMAKYRGFEDQVIFFFDNMHAAFDDPDFLSELKDMLENSGFRIIGATTQQQYETHFEPDEEMTERCQPYALPQMDEESAKEVISFLLHEKAHDLLIDPGVIDALYQFSSDSNTSQPNASLKLIKQCLNHIRSNHREAVPEMTKACRLVRMQKTLMKKGKKFIRNYDPNEQSEERLFTFILNTLCLTNIVDDKVKELEPVLEQNRISVRLTAEIVEQVAKKERRAARKQHAA